MTIKETIRKYRSELKNVTHIPSKEIEILVMYLLDKNVIWLHLNYNDIFKKEKELQVLVNKRKTHYPMEYIIGKASFYGEQFYTHKKVLIPRPETEILVDKAKEMLEGISKPKVIEIGTGSGIISVMLALLIKDIEIIAVDINEFALELAQKNAKKLKVEHKIKFIKSDLFTNLDKGATDFDMCISNPPYIANNYKLPKNVEFEPKNALFGGDVGNELLNDIVNLSSDEEIQYLCCEMGYDQKEILTKLFKKMNTKSFEFYQDLSGFDRGFCLEFNTNNKDKNV